MTRRGRLRAARGGSVAVETALVVSLFLLPLLLGMWDFAIVLQAGARLDQALEGAVFYAYASAANAQDNAGLTTAANNAFGSGAPALTVGTPQTSYYCITPPGGSRLNGSAAGASTQCGSGQVLAAYLSLSFSTTVALPVAVPWLGGSVPLSTSAIVRVN